MQKLTDQYPAIRFVAPFALFIVLLGVRSHFGWDLKWEYPFQALAVAVVVLLVSLPVIPFRLVRPWSSVAIGAGVFLIWIGPDLLWPLYRHHRIFENSLMGAAASSLPPGLRSDRMFLAFRFWGTAILVPIIEELFWRGWLMRYLINPDFEKVPAGTYSAMAVWTSAGLFATEHGPYWDVGLLAGLIYNLWMVRTRNLMDCMLAHAVTNACLAIYVAGFGHWEYWL